MVFCASPAVHSLPQRCVHAAIDSANLEEQGLPRAAATTGPPALEHSPPGQPMAVALAPAAEASGVDASLPSRDTSAVTPSSTSCMVSSCIDSRSMALSDADSGRGPGGSTASTAGAARSVRQPDSSAASDATAQAATRSARAADLRGRGCDPLSPPITPASEPGAAAGGCSTASSGPVDATPHAAPHTGPGRPGSSDCPGVGDVVAGAATAFSADGGSAEPQEPLPSGPPTRQTAAAMTSGLCLPPGDSKTPPVPFSPEGLPLC